MRIVLRFVGVLAVLLACAAGPSALAQPASDVYVVRAGDTLYRIATTHGMTVDELKRLNGLEGDGIEVGQRLRLSSRVPAESVVNEPPDLPPDPIDAPVDPPRRAVQPAVPVSIPMQERAAPEPAETGPQRTHVVQSGETLFAIALRYDTTVESLRRLNGIQGDLIEVGQRLVVGGGGTGSTAAVGPAPRRWSMENTTIPADQIHFVEPGETLYSIATATGLSVRELLAVNNLSTAPLEPGMILNLPRYVDPRLAIETRTLPEADTVGLALVYPGVMTGREMASGMRYDPQALTASHRSLPFGTVLLVTNPDNGRSTFVRIMDRGPVSQSYLIELSEQAAQVLDLDPNAARRVELRSLP
jgi:LysM repeat protein